MDHLNYDIELFDMSGNQIGLKKRKDINKVHDIFHGVKVFICSLDGRLALVKIAAKSGVLTNLFVGQWGIPVATMKRAVETPMEAALRSLAREVGIVVKEKDHLVQLGEGMYTIAPGVVRKHTTFALATSQSLTLNGQDGSELTWLTQQEVLSRIAQTPTQFAPTFLALWQMYHIELPL